LSVSVICCLCWSETEHAFKHYSCYTMDEFVSRGWALDAVLMRI
jgi:hypothetical protein